MNTKHRCIICGNKKIHSYSAEVTPFIKNRMELQTVKKRLLFCNKCKFAYFEPRPLQEELSKIYNGYRDGEYQKLRQSFEPEYTKELNQLIGNKNEIETRKKNMESFIRDYLDIKDIKSVLDYGGDRGQFIPYEIGLKYVYDVSKVKTESGVTSIEKDQLERKINSFDLVMCCHVLEHVPDPKTFFLDIVRYIDSEGFLYLELPYDTPFLESHIERRSIIKKIKNLIKRIMTRIGVHRIFYLMHEHINYFSEKSIESLISQANLKLIAKRNIELDVGWTKLRICSFLAKKEQ